MQNDKDNQSVKTLEFREWDTERTRGEHNKPRKSPAVGIILDTGELLGSQRALISALLTNLLLLNSPRMRPSKSGINLSASLKLDINASLDHFTLRLSVTYNPRLCGIALTWNFTTVVHYIFPAYRCEGQVFINCPFMLYHFA